jgi:hypothetical protein
MRIIDTNQTWLSERAQIVYQEILNDIDVHEYWHPKINEERWPDNEPKHKTFEQAYMKFLNGNLNYYDFPNMVAHSQEQDGWNLNFPDTLKFCEDLRKITGNRGPFGRMCIWDLPPGRRLLPHVDDFEYHRHIVRNIFVVSPDLEDKTKIVIQNNIIKPKQGTMFQFQPHKENHEFVNDSDQHFYFLGFDYWIMDRLAEAKNRINIDTVINDTNRVRFTESGDLIYGSIGTKCKYQSTH